MSGSTNDTGNETYNPPFTVLSVATAAVGAMAAAWLFSWAYGPAEHYSPIVQLNFLLAVAMGWLIGKAARIMLRKKRINRVGPALLVGLVGGIVGVWASWLTYCWVISGYDFEFYWECLVNPDSLRDIATYLSENPMWSLDKFVQRENVFFYYLTWFGEAALIAIIPIVMCGRFVRENTLCEQCNEWLGPTGDIALFSLDAAPNKRMIAAVKGGDISDLLALPRVVEDEKTPHWMEAHGYSCPNCRSPDSFVSVDLGEAKGKKGKQENSVKTLARHIPIDMDTERRLFEPDSAPLESGDSSE